MSQKKDAQFSNIPFQYRLRSKIRGLLPYLHKSFFSILIFICICISHSFFPSISNRINNYSNIDNLFVTFGVVLSAIATLTISLAIIPIQRAIEVFSPTIRRNYINDIFIQGILILLGIFIFISFSLPFIGIQKTWKLYIQFEIIAISLDLVRWHFRRISFLLEPYNAIKSLSKRACSIIRKTQRMIAVNSFKELKKRPKCEWSMELLKKNEIYFYKFFEEKYVRLLNFWIDELEDITLRAITRSEKLTVKHGINNIVEIAFTFLDSRKANFQLYPEGFFTFGSNLDNIINPVYEKLINICRLAIHNEDEQSGIQVVQALSYIAIKTTELKGYHEYSAPLASLPIGYLKRCSELSYNSDLDEISWNVVNELPKISEKAPQNLVISDVHLHVLRNLSSAAQHYFLQPQKDHIAKQATSNMCRVARHLIESNYYDSRSYISFLLKELEKNIPFMLLSEKALDMNAFPPYSMANEFSLGNIVQIASSHIKAIQDKQWVNPYRDFMKLNEEIYRHFRHIAENNQYNIQNSFLSWVVTDTIKHIARVYLHILKQKLTDNPQHNKEFINQVGWYQSFFWAMFSKRKEVDSAKAEEVSDAMATIGLQFANAECYEVMDYSIPHICSIAKYYIEKTATPDEFRVADILICAWQLRYFAEYKNNTHLVIKANEEIKKIVDLALQKQANVNEEFETRKQQLEDFIKDFNPVRIPYFSRDWLKMFIQKNGG